MIASKISSDVLDSCRDIALVQAASGGEVATVQWLLDRGASLHVNEDQPLFEACYHGHANVVDVLAKYGAEIRSSFDRSLVAAAFKGHIQVAQVLLQNGRIHNLNFIILGFNV